MDSRLKVNMKYFYTIQGFILVLVFASCRENMNSNSNTDSKKTDIRYSNQSNRRVLMSEEDKAVLCSCLYKELKFSRAESSIDGSAEIYLHTGEIGIEGFLEKEQKMEAYLDTFVMRGTDGSTLAIARCLETVGKY